MALENTLKTGDRENIQPQHRLVLAAIDELLDWYEQHDLEVVFE